MISNLKKLFAEHGIPESILPDSGPQFSSNLFKELAVALNLAHHTTSPSEVKIIKGLLTRYNCARHYPCLALLAYWGTPVDSDLWSPAKMLYQYALFATVPQKIKDKDPYVTDESERLKEHATQV